MQSSGTASPVTVATPDHDRLWDATGQRSAFTSARDQLIPSITAVMAAPRTATVAASIVTAAATHRSRRSRRARGTCGKAEGIAGRISTRIVDAPSRALGRRDVGTTTRKSVKT